MWNVARTPGSSTLPSDSVPPKAAGATRLREQRFGTPDNRHYDQAPHVRDARFNTRR